MDGSNLGSLERSELRMKEAIDRTGASCGLQRESVYVQVGLRGAERDCT